MQVISNLIALQDHLSDWLKFGEKDSFSLQIANGFYFSHDQIDTVLGFFMEDITWNDVSQNGDRSVIQFSVNRS